MHLRLVLLFLLLSGATCLRAQERPAWQSFVDEVSDDEYAEQQGWTSSMEELSEIYAHPLDINTATREQLMQIPFLSERQIEDIHTYVFLHRGMRSLSELMSISSIDFLTRHYLSYFLVADQSVFERRDTLTLRRLLRDSHHELSTRFDVPLYYRAGYSYPPSKGGYRGSAFYHKLQYRLTNRRHLLFGVSAEKDQGEPFHGNGGWDSYGVHLLVRDMGLLRTAVVGDFKLGFGEGLVVNNGFSTGKSYMMGSPSQGIRARRGTDEINFFRGGAATLRWGHTDFSLWVSYRNIDATLDSTGDARTLLTSGLHRTDAELQKKGNLGSFMSGADITWRNRGFHVGGTGYFQRFHRVLSPGTARYRQIFPHGRNFGVMGIHYGYNHLWFSVAGETAYSTDRHGWATLHRVRWKITPDYILSASHRFYSYHYYSFYASALSENSDVQNESGATIRLDATPIRGLSLFSYADFFYHPWPRYGLDHSSSGQEFSLRLQYEVNNHHSLALRYQLKRKEKSNEMQLHNRLRLQYTYIPHSFWNLQSTLNLHAMQGLGYSLSQRLRYVRNHWRCGVMLTWFDTPSYDTRIYLYEPLLSEMFRYPSVYGRGVRMTASGMCRLWHNRLTLEVLYGLVRYTDRDTQSSGMQQIFSPWKNDLSLQVRFRI